MYSAEAGAVAWTVGGGGEGGYCEGDGGKELDYGRWTLCGTWTKDVCWRGL